MVDTNDHDENRRKVLKAIGGSTIPVAFVSSATADESERRPQLPEELSENYEVLRGSFKNPVPNEKIKKVREDFAVQQEIASNEYARIDLKETLSEVDIVAYNILTGEGGKPRE
ncbi:hypothetical protein [Natronobeatus ordinarius]|uniref:hypothetical protein n=1 Tax=Natronobeatus ordinarius TaxID=2963433 RepID=UPI0020CFB095|nr:hypothetical protein [Natronobeatus ordinarius]